MMKTITIEDAGVLLEEAKKRAKEMTREGMHRFQEAVILGADEGAQWRVWLIEMVAGAVYAGSLRHVLAEDFKRENLDRVIDEALRVSDELTEGEDA